jgi:4-amino-4-deoxy-L-arabinose transferase-like glycosyltransferase
LEFSFNAQGPGRPGIYPVFLIGEGPKIKTMNRSSLGTIASRVSHRDLAILVFVVAATAIPFLTQPFNIDDSFYMDMARNARQNPFFPNDLPYVFQGQLMPDMGSHSHPLLQTYFLAAIQNVFGEGPGKEWIYHLFALIYPILAVLSFYFLCVRFLERPLWPSILLACSPLFLVVQHTLITDLPMLAFWLGAICCFLWAVEKKSGALYVWSAVFQTAALFTSYQSLALVPLLGFYQLRKGGGKRGWACIAIAPILVGAWYAASCFYYERILFGMTWDYIKSRHPFTLQKIWIKFVSILQYQGWLLIFPFFIYYVFGRSLKWRVIALVWIGAACVTWLAVPHYRLVDQGIFLFGLAAGIVVLTAMGGFAWAAFCGSLQTLRFSRTESQFISLWYLGVLFYGVFFLTDGSARYILPLAPPLFICFYHRLQVSEAVEYRHPARFLNSAMLASGSVVISLAWGLALSHADQEFARIYPRAARDFSRMGEDGDAYCVGEWGFRYYFGRAGAAPLPADVSTVRAGSLIVVPRMALPHEIPEPLKSSTTRIRTFAYKPATILRIFDWKTPAAFYASEWGLIPFSFSRENLEEIEILRVGTK